MSGTNGYLWVLEHYEKHKWLACPGYVSCTREQARKQQIWAERNLPGMRFRVVRYVRGGVRLQGMR